MKETIAKLKQSDLRRAAEEVLLIIFLLLIFDFLVAFLGGSYLSANTGIFWGKTRIVILSDLLFLEGGVIFAIGSIVRIMETTREKKPSSESTPEIHDKMAQSRGRKPYSGTLMIVIGAILIALSIIFGTLPL